MEKGDFNRPPAEFNIRFSIFSLSPPFYFTFLRLRPFYFIFPPILFHFILFDSSPGCIFRTPRGKIPSFFSFRRCKYVHVPPNQYMITKSHKFCSISTNPRSESGVLNTRWCFRILLFLGNFFMG